MDYLKCTGNIYLLIVPKAYSTISIDVTFTCNALEDFSCASVLVEGNIDPWCRLRNNICRFWFCLNYELCSNNKTIYNIIDNTSGNTLDIR